MKNLANKLPLHRRPDVLFIFFTGEPEDSCQKTLDELYLIQATAMYINKADDGNDRIVHAIKEWIITEDDEEDEED